MDEYYNLIKQIPSPTSPIEFNTGGRLVIALFEFRPIDEIKWVLNAVLRVYKPSEIGMAIVHGPSNSRFLHQNFRGWKNLKLINTGVANHTQKTYSQFLKKPQTWEYFKEWEHVLVYQCDALLIRRIPQIYFKYDYVGSQWKPSFYEKHKNLNRGGGNGGFSLRRVKSMIKVCEPNRRIPSHNIRGGYEDIFFSSRPLLKYVNKPSLKVQFGVEAVYYPTPIGVHKFYRYVKGQNYRRLLNYIQRLLLSQ